MVYMLSCLNFIAYYLHIGSPLGVDYRNVVYKGLQFQVVWAFENNVFNVETFVCLQKRNFRYWFARMRTVKPAS